jgi:hypothetical protein
VHVGVDEAREQHAARQVDHLLVGVPSGDVQEGPPVDDLAVADEHARVRLGTQLPAGERVFGGVEHRAAEQRHQGAS